MKRTPYRGILIGVALAACTPFVVTEAYGSDEPAAWAPPDAALYVGVTNYDEFVAAAKKTSTWQTLNDPAMKETFAPWKEFGTKLQKLVAGRLGLDSPKQLEVYPQGGLAIFGTTTPSEREDGEEEGRLGVVMDMGENLAGMKRLTRTVVEKALENEARRSTKEVAGAEITTIRFKTPEATDDADGTVAGGAPIDREILDLIEALPMEDMLKAGLAENLSNLEPPEELAFTFVGSKLVLAWDTETVVQTARRLKKGKEGSFAVSPAMGTLRRHNKLKGQVEAVINLPVILESLARKVADAPHNIRGAGLNALGPFVMALELAPGNGIDSRMGGFLEIKGERTGVAKLLTMENTQTVPGATIGADTATYGSLNLNPAVVLDEFLQITNRIDPERGEQARAGMKVPQQDGSVLDIQKDIVNHLSGPLFGKLTLAKPYDSDSVNAVIALGHSSRAAIDKLFALLPPGMLIPREMMGSMIYESPMIPVQGLAAAITDRVLMILGTKGAIESHIRAEGRDDGGLADDPDFKKIARLMPKQSCAVMYSNNQAVFDAQLAISKAGDLTGEPPMFSPAGTYLRWILLQNFGGADGADMASLRKYFSVSMATMSSETDGLRFDALSLLP